MSLPFFPPARQLLAASARGPGPWVAFESSIDRRRGEGGLAFNWSGVAQDSLSAFALDLGAGRADSGANHVATRVSWGVRFVPMRTEIFHDNGICRAIIAPASGARLYVAARRETGGPQALEVTAGIELHPFGGRWAITVHNQD